MGHYTCFVKQEEKQTWLLYDDSAVTEVPEKRIKSRHAYILFYKRKDLAWKASSQEVMPSFKDYFSGRPILTIYGKGYLFKLRKDTHPRTPFVVKIGSATLYLRKSAILRDGLEDFLIGSSDLKDGGCQVF